MIKQAFLEQEKRRIEVFLSSFDLSFGWEDDSFFIEENDKIIASISIDHHIIKGLAIDEEYRGLNLAGELVTHAIQTLIANNIYSYHVFTKSVYIDIFQSMGFRLLANTSKVAFMEGGAKTIEQVIGDIKKQVETYFSIDLKKHDIGCAVVNCNPMTLGHYQLIEKASKEHEYFIVFVVETDESVFTFKERFSLVYLALKEFSNIIVLPSTDYVVSKSTFPSYFLKTIDERETEHAKLDALIFLEYFIPLLNIRLRHVGGETDLVMVKYNQILHETLQNRLEAIERFDLDGVTISASLVRKLMKEKKYEEALSYVPKAIQPLLKGIMIEKNDVHR